MLLGESREIMRSTLVVSHLYAAAPAPNESGKLLRIVRVLVQCWSICVRNEGNGFWKRHDIIQQELIVPGPNQTKWFWACIRVYPTKTRQAQISDRN